MSNLKELYKISKAAKVGEECICPSCKTKFVKTNYQQAFCKSKGGTICKDFYWNNVTPTKKCNITRISPASAAWQCGQSEIRQARRKVHVVFCPWHDDDWCEGDGGSGVTER